jgi:hypothetical protein
MYPTSTQTRAIDLATLTDKELKSYLNNCKRYGQTELAREVLTHMFSRGIASNVNLKVFEWNQDSVREIMQPFKEKASEVKDNRRKAYTEAGGFRIGRPKGHPEKHWIDTYCAMKTSAMNAEFVCRVKSPGDEPEFELHLDGTVIASYEADRLDEAFEDRAALGS